MSIALDHALVLLIPLPSNVTGVMIANQDRPVLRGAPMSHRLAGAAVHDPGANLGASERVRSGVKRIREYVLHRAVAWRPPRNLSIRVPDRNAELFLTKPQQHLTDAAQLFQFLEHQPE